MRKEKLNAGINPILLPAGVGFGEAFLHKQVVVGPVEDLNRLLCMPTFLVKALQDSAGWIIHCARYKHNMTALPQVPGQSTQHTIYAQRYHPVWQALF